MESFIIQTLNFSHFTMESYIDFIVSFSERLNPDFIIERFAGEVPPRFISDSKWGIVRYYEVLKQIENASKREKHIREDCFLSKF